ncbi:MAG: peptidyl-prolyl cis-trans isomerase [bacterium]|nr:peptidyl-prolyl cis-trans isomerase [bacterium]
MSRVWKSEFVVIGLMLTALITGCSKTDDKVIAEVGSYEITVDQFDELTKALPQNFTSAQEEFDTKSQILDSMIVQRLLVLAGKEKGVDKLEEVAQAVAANRDKFLLDILYKRQIEDKVTASDAELQELWGKLEFRHKVSHILVADKDTADALVSRLAAGENFEQLAFDASTDQTAKRNRGELGFYQYGSMPEAPEFEEAMLALDLNEISTPVKTRYGYHIIKVTERQPNDSRQPFDKMKASLERTLKHLKRTRLTTAYLESIKSNYPFTVDRSTLDYLIHKRNDLYPAEVLKNLPKNDFDDRQLDRNERELVLATWEGGQVTLGEYLNLARALPPATRPEFENYDQMPMAVLQAKLTDVLILEATKAGVENDDEFKKKLDLFKDLTIADVMRNDSIMVQKQPTEEQMRQYYDAHQNEYMDAARVHIYEILVSDELLANKLTNLRSLADFRKRAVELTERPALRTTEGDMGYIVRDRYPEIFDAAFRTPIGEIGGPVPTVGGKYSVYYVVDKIDAQVRDFLAVRPMISSKLAADEASQRFTQWVKEHKDATKIEINYEVLWSTVNKEKYTSTENPAGVPSGN